MFSRLDGSADANTHRFFETKTGMVEHRLDSSCATKYVRMVLISLSKLVCIIIVCINNNLSPNTVLLRAREE
eukprot:1160050-Pelagomonas_calceolata.AAC.6